MLVSLQFCLDENKGNGGEGSVILSRISFFSWQSLQLYQGGIIYAQIKGISLLPKSVF